MRRRAVSARAPHRNAAPYNPTDVITTPPSRAHFKRQRGFFAPRKGSTEEVNFRRLNVVVFPSEPEGGDRTSCADRPVAYSAGARQGVAHRQSTAHPGATGCVARNRFTPFRIIRVRTRVRSEEILSKSIASSAKALPHIAEPSIRTKNGSVKLSVYYRSSRAQRYVYYDFRFLLVPFRAPRPTDM